MSHPQLEKFKGRLVSVRVPGLRGKRTGWVIDADDEEYDWRDDLGDAEEQVHAGSLVPVIYLGEIDDGEMVEAQGFLLYEPKTLDLFMVDEGSLEEESVGSLDELVVTPLASVDDDEDQDEDEDDADVSDDDAAGADGEGDEEYKDDTSSDDD